MLKEIQLKLKQLSEPDHGKWEVRLIDILKTKPKKKKKENIKILKQKKQMILMRTALYVTPKHQNSVSVHYRRRQRKDCKEEFAIISL